MYSIPFYIFAISFTCSLVISAPITTSEQEIKHEKVIATAHQLLKELSNENSTQQSLSRQKTIDNNDDDEEDYIPVITFSTPDYQNSNDYEVDDLIDLDALIDLYQRQRLTDLFNEYEDDDNQVPIKNTPIIDDRMMKIEDQ